MSNNRYVPIIIGISSIGIAVFFIFGFSGWWRYIPATLLLMFGWPTLKTGFFASNKEINELTGPAPVSEETKDKFKDRM
jgi:hypothetical protein